MKLTQILYKQHIGWHFTKHWHYQARKKVAKADALTVLEKKSVPIHRAEDFLKEERTFEKVEIIGYKENPVKFDETHPDWHDDPILQFKDDHVLVAGLDQAKVITRSVELQEGLPNNNLLKDIPKEVNSLAKQIIQNSHMFDAEQQKLPKIKDPKRPYHGLPRIYGITQNRRNLLILSKFIQLIETTSDQQTVQDKYLFNDLLFQYPFQMNNINVQFQLTGDFYLTSEKPLKAVTNESTVDGVLPDLSPLAPTVSIIPEHIYRFENVYPIMPSVKKKHPHTLFVHFNKEEVKNLFEEPVMDDQIFGRSLLKAFTVAASYAKQTYGPDVQSLPEPITIQCVQTDGHMFHFGVLQLNTLDLVNGANKNVWYHTPFQYLFEKCSYNLGKPMLEGYNSDVLKQLYAFYNNV